MTKEELDNLAHTHCLNNGYTGLNEDDYIPMGNTKWGDVMYDIEEAYKAGYAKCETDRQAIYTEKACDWLSDFLCGRCEDSLNVKFCNQLRKAMSTTNED